MAKTAKQQTIRRVLLVCAPDVPSSETKALEAHILEALADPEYKVIVNYNISVQELLVGDKTLFISAPDIPPSECMVLRKKFNDPKVKVIVVNYNVSVLEF